MHDHERRQPELYEALEQAKGEPKQVARAISDFIRDDANLATKADLKDLELRLIKWLIGTAVGSALASTIAIIGVLTRLHG